MSQPKTTPHGSSRACRPRANNLPTFLASSIQLTCDAVISYNPLQRIIFFNQGAEKMFGYSADEIIDAPIEQILPNLPFPSITDTPRSTIGKRKDGCEFPTEMSIVQTQYDDETQFTVIIRDMGDHERQHQSLAHRVEQLSLALAGAHEGVWDWDLHTNQVYFSPEWETMLGYQSGELQPTLETWEKRLHPDDMERVNLVLNDHLDGKTPFYLSEQRLQRKDGSWCWVLDRGAIIKRDSQGKPLRMSGTHTDITELKETQLALESQVQAHTAELDRLYQSLRETERRQNALLNNIPDMAWLKDHDSRFIAVNQPFAQACGWTPHALVGKTDLDIWPPKLAEQYRTDDAEVMNSRQIKRVEEPIADVTGNVAWIETIKTPVVDENDQVIGTVGIARDISERKQLDEIRRQTQANLEHLVQERTEALAQKNQELENQIAERKLIENDLATQRDFALQVIQVQVFTKVPMTEKAGQIPDLKRRTESEGL